MSETPETDVVAIFDREKFQAAIDCLDATAADIAEAGEDARRIAASIAAAQANAADEPGSSAAAVGPAMSLFMAALVDSSAELAAEVTPIAEKVAAVSGELRDFYDEQTSIRPKARRM